MISLLFLISGLAYGFFSKKFKSDSINLPAAGWHSCDSGKVYSEGKTGDYWSSTSDDTKTDCAWSLHSVLNDVKMESYKRCFGNIVRLVLNP